MNIYWHTIDLTMGNAWLLYEHENKRLNRRSQSMSQFQFKRNVAEAWMAQNADGSIRSRRRRSLSRIRNRRARSSVPLTTRYDRKDHMPHATSGKNGRQRCHYCNALTNTYCVKCEAHLCMFFNRNCFRPFHYRELEDADSDSDQNAEAIDDPDALPLDAAAIDDPDSPPLDAAELQSDESNE